MGNEMSFEISGAMLLQNCEQAQNPADSMTAIASKTRVLKLVTRCCYKLHKSMKSILKEVFVMHIHMFLPLPLSHIY